MGDVLGGASLLSASAGGKEQVAFFCDLVLPVPPARLPRTDTDDDDLCLLLLPPAWAGLAGSLAPSPAAVRKSSGLPERGRSTASRGEGLLGWFPGIGIHFAAEEESRTFPRIASPVAPGHQIQPGTASLPHVLLKSWKCTSSSPPPGYSTDPQDMSSHRSAKDRKVLPPPRSSGDL